MDRRVSMGYEESMGGEHPMDRDELLELVLDLKHDLGKYIRLPLAMLPKDAPDSAVRAALEQALWRTRRSGEKVTDAKTLWQAFSEQAGKALQGSPAFASLTRAVQSALQWERALGPRATARESGGSDAAPSSEALDRVALERDLDQVNPAIQALIDEIREAL